MQRIRAAELDAGGLDIVVDALEAGGVVCLPTDTVYGLAVDPHNAQALERIYRLKGREASKPILVLVESIEMARSLSLPNMWLESLAARFWPGPLTLVTPAIATLPDRLTARTGTLGMRWPDSPLPVRIIRAFGGPLTATSANRSGQPVVRTPEEAMDQLGDEIDVLIEAETLVVEGMPSTVVDITTDTPKILREGRVPARVLTRFWAEIGRRVV